MKIQLVAHHGLGVYKEYIMAGEGYWREIEVDA
jgi:hypothetical protein